MDHCASTLIGNTPKEPNSAKRLIGTYVQQPEIPLVRMGVEKSSYHQLSQNEIGSDNPCSQQLSGATELEAL